MGSYLMLTVVLLIVVAAIFLAFVGEDASAGRKPQD